MSADSSSKHHEAINHGAWASLLDLLSFQEYFVTVDHSELWQRHVSWSKPKGNDLRTYVTQRFASNMVVLSLMLGAQINVFFNSSGELSHMRSLLGSESYGEFGFWIGIVIALDASVTIMALVATFTLWGMIGAISDNNTHALLRSSIGQYVISLPPTLVVTALYLFMLWMLLSFMALMNGPSRIVLAAVVVFLFFNVVVPLSAFGRLIIHTGAMAKKRVLEEDFEKALLPSGLHASLLIRATGQKRKYANAINQYQKKSTKPAHSRNGSSRSVSSFSAMHIDDDPEVPTTTLTPTQSEDFSFPRPSLLNSVSGSSSLKDIIEKALSEHEQGNSEDDLESGQPPDLALPSPDDNTRQNRFSLIDHDDNHQQRDAQNHGSLQRTGSSKNFQRRRPRISVGKEMTRRPSRMDPRNLLSEWVEETTVRDLYDERPAGIYVPSQTGRGGAPIHSIPSSANRNPRASMLNRRFGWKSLSNLLSSDVQLDTPDSSIGDAIDLEEDQMAAIGEENETWDTSRSRENDRLLGDANNNPKGSYT